MLEFNNISFAYGEKQIFSDFSLTLGDNSSTAIMGRSGCGKSTLLNIAAGLLIPSHGNVIRTGKVSYVFQEPRLIPWMNTLDNVNIVLGGKKNTLASASRVLERVGLGGALSLYPAELSGGMSKRVSLARALVYGADILLIDEPFGELDNESKLIAAQMIKEASSGRTVLTVLHNADDAGLLGARIVSL